MRRSLLIFLLIIIVILTYAIHTVSTLLSLLIEDASADAIHRSEIPAPNSTLLESRPLLIPKIIHQTYINDTIPVQWQLAQQSCRDLHPDYEYILWTDSRSLDFIAKEYPWFLATFTGYKHAIQRADAIRYFVLVHYGGIYIDLDLGCKRRLDPLLSYKAWLRRTIPTGISNDIMGSVKQHPFFQRVIESLQGADRKWVLPYITIMASTGPLFLSVIWKKWMSEHANLTGAAGGQEDWPGRVRVLMPDAYKKNSWSFFTSYMGSSWHGRDARFIFWMGRNWMLLTALGFLAAAVLGMGIWWMYSRLLLLGARRKASPRISSGRIPVSGRVPLWKKWTNGYGGKASYELVEQHDA